MPEQAKLGQIAILPGKAPGYGISGVVTAYRESDGVGVRWALCMIVHCTVPRKKCIQYTCAALQCSA